MKKLFIITILTVIFSGVSYGSIHEEYLKIDQGKFSSEEVEMVLDKIGNALNIETERKNIMDVYRFKKPLVDRDIFLYRLLSLSGYNVYLNDVLEDALGLNLIDRSMYYDLKKTDTITSEMYEDIMNRYLYFDLNNKDRNIIFYLVNSGALNSAQVLIDGGIVINDVNPNGYFKSGYYYMKLSSNDIRKNYYLGISKDNLLMDRSSYLFLPHVNQEKFYAIDLFLIDSVSREYNNISDKIKVEFDSDSFSYYPSKKRFWVYERDGDTSFGTMKIKYKDELMEVKLKREVKPFIMIDHDQDDLEPCSYYFVKNKYQGDKILEEDILVDSKKYAKSYIGIRYRADKNPTIPIYFNKVTSSNYYYEIKPSSSKYHKKIYVYDEKQRPYQGYISIDLKDRSGKKYVIRKRIKPNGLVNIIFYDNRFNRLMDLHVEDLYGERVSEVFSINSKSNEALTINIKKE